MDDAKTDTMNLYRVNTKTRTTDWPVHHVPEHGSFHAQKACIWWDNL